MRTVADRLQEGSSLHPDPNVAAVLSYYKVTSEDYADWSRRRNMHFGLWRWGVNPLRREAMLEAMNHEILGTIERRIGRPQRVADLGCGVGASSRTAALRWPHASVKGVNIVAEQIAVASLMASKENLSERLSFGCTV